MGFPLSLSLPLPLVGFCLSFLFPFPLSFVCFFLLPLDVFTEQFCPFPFSKLLSLDDFLTFCPRPPPRDIPCFAFCAVPSEVQSTMGFLCRFHSCFHHPPFSFSGQRFPLRPLKTVAQGWLCKIICPLPPMCSCQFWSFPVQFTILFRFLCRFPHTSIPPFPKISGH